MWAVGGDADPLAGRDELDDHPRAGVGLAGARRALDRQSTSRSSASAIRRRGGHDVVSSRASERARPATADDPRRAPQEQVADRAVRPGPSMPLRERPDRRRCRALRAGASCRSAGAGISAAGMRIPGVDWTADAGRSARAVVDRLDASPAVLPVAGSIGVVADRELVTPAPGRTGSGGRATASIGCRRRRRTARPPSASGVVDQSSSGDASLQREPGPPLRLVLAAVPVEEVRRGASGPLLVGSLRRVGRHVLASGGALARAVSACAVAISSLGASVRRSAAGTSRRPGSAIALRRRRSSSQSRSIHVETQSSRL